MTDTHAHIYLEEFDNDRLDMLVRSSEAGISKIWMPNIDHTSIDRMLELEEKTSGMCEAMIGLHPCSVNKDFQRELYIAEDWLQKRAFRAIGEMGTDLYWDKTWWSEQKEAFTIQIGWAKKYKVPVVIHCRETLEETIVMVEKLKDENLKGVFHCFTGTVEQANRITAMGFYLGIGGVATFKNGGMDKVIPELDVHHIVLETDSPYLAPVPHRGKRNEPAYLELIAQRLAALKNLSLADLKTITSENAAKLFNDENPAGSN
ncbi:MAG: TatD family hydrolase [Cyclobacteriaceae bacterium]|jgi:TatD DNase family protein|nr:TatD family hydrolase [Cyclobacteriaceae bacterium]